MHIKHAKMGLKRLKSMGNISSCESIFQLKSAGMPRIPWAKKPAKVTVFWPKEVPMVNPGDLDQEQSNAIIQAYCKKKAIKEKVSITFQICRAIRERHFFQLIRLVSILVEFSVFVCPSFYIWVMMKWGVSVESKNGENPIPFLGNKG